MIPTVEMIDAGWKATLGLNKIQVERILTAAFAAMPPEDDVTALKRMAMSVGMEFTPHKQAPVQADAEHEAMPGLALKRYTPCGGCGADKPSDRCIGCLHDFGGGSWETSKMFSNQPAPDIAAENKRLREALDSIIVYGADTLSGRADGPSDAAWYREAVREMRNRARSAATKEQAP